MKFFLLFLLALQASDCGSAEAAKPAPQMPESGRDAMTVDGKQPGKIEKQADGTYLLRHPDGSATKTSANEMILMPEPKGVK